MKLKYYSSISPTNDLAINDTTDITAKKLLTMFLEDHETIDDILTDSDAYKNLAAILEKTDLPKDLEDAVSYIPWATCHAFLKFLASCPAVHLTID